MNIRIFRFAAISIVVVSALLASAAIFVPRAAHAQGVSNYLCGAGTTYPGVHSCVSCTSDGSVSCGNEVDFGPVSGPDVFGRCWTSCTCSPLWDEGHSSNA